MTDERRVVTVLFADVSGSTSLGEALDPEDLRALLGRYYAIAKDVVATHGGTVEKFIGDAVMAIFGLRRAHGDDAVRALSAALELRERVRSDTRLGERMPLRLGVNTGDVVASRSDEGGDFLVTGDAVNVAARLQQAAAPWAILAGERSVRAARGEFRFSPLQEVEAKGKAAAVRAGELIGRAHTLASRTPIFGRDADLAQMELVARRAFEEQRPFLVSIIAPAGTGKTRLLEEFLARLRDIEAQARVAVAQCLPYGERLTYWPLRAVLFRLLALDEDAQPEEVRGAIDAWLTAAGVEDAQMVGDLLASTIGAGEAETSDRSALFTAWRTFIEAASRQAPLVVAVEDLHWSSDTLLDLFEFVLQPRADTRAMLIALARPELLDRRPGWGGGRRNHVSISLEPLDDVSTRRLVETLAEGAPAALVDAVVARAEGNPFFVGEMVGAVLEPVQSFDVPAQIQAALARLPDTVQATVLARLDALPDDEREVLRIGSVFGRTFRPAGVAALLGREADLSVLCERLTERDLVRPSGADGYAFRHILIREVAYSTLARSTRAALHGAAGRWLEGVSAGREEALAELVAYHYREAASLATAMDLEDAPGLRVSARLWLTRAAEVARAAAAVIEAREHARAALEFAETEDLPELYELLGDVEIGGRVIAETYAKALDLARAAGRPPEMLLRLLAKQLMVETRSQGSVATRPSRAEIDELRAEGRRLLERVTDPRTKARFLAADAFYPFWLRADGRDVLDPAILEAAQVSATTAVELAREIEDHNLESAALDALGSMAQGRREWAKAIELAQRRIAKGPMLALTERIDAYSVATWSTVIAGELELADDYSAAGLAIVQPGQAPDWTLHLLAWRLLALLQLGKWDEVEFLAERAYRLWLEAGRPPAGYAMRGFAAALVVAHARRNTMLIEHCRQAVAEVDARFQPRRPLLAAFASWSPEELARKLPDGMTSAALDGVTLALRVCSDSGEMINADILRAALEMARRFYSPIGEAEVLRATGLAGDDMSALTRAHELFDARGARPSAACTSAELAIRSADRKRLDDALGYLESLRDEVQVERYLKAWSAR